MKVGYVLLIRDDPQSRRPQRYTEVRDLAQQAEALGFDSLWLYDHFFYRDADQPTRGIWECWTFLAALAEATRRVEIGPLVACTAYRNPALLAKMAASLDEVSAGRLILGLGAGWNEPEFRAFGYPFDHLAGRFAEALQIIRPLLRTGHVDFHGSYYDAPDCEIAPRGPRPEGPPLLLAGSRPRMLGLCAAYADLWNTAYLSRADQLAAPRAKLEAACAAAGRDPATLPVTALLAAGFPDLAPPPEVPGADGYLSGTSEEIAARLQEFAAQGAAHVMIHCTPTTAEALDRLGAGLRAYRQLGGAA